jgi:hypothetical protein
MISTQVDALDYTVVLPDLFTLYASSNLIISLKKLCLKMFLHGVKVLSHDRFDSHPFQYII